MMIEHKVGETFEIGDVLLKVELSTDACAGCYFRDKECWIDDDPEIWSEHDEFCVPARRLDYKNVIFVEQKRKTQL